MKKLMYLSISMLCLAITMLIGFHIGSQSVKAQAPEAISGYRIYQDGGHVRHFVLLSNGDIYRRQHPQGSESLAPLVYLGNFWEGGPVPTSPQSLGGVKEQYK